MKKISKKKEIFKCAKVQLTLMKRLAIIAFNNQKLQLAAWQQQQKGSPTAAVGFTDAKNTTGCGEWHSGVLTIAIEVNLEKAFYIMFI